MIASGDIEYQMMEREMPDGASDDDEKVEEEEHDDDIIFEASDTMKAALLLKNIFIAIYCLKFTVLWLNPEKINNIAMIQFALIIIVNISTSVFSHNVGAYDWSQLFSHIIDLPLIVYFEPITLSISKWPEAYTSVLIICVVIQNIVFHANTNDNVVRSIVPTVSLTLTILPGVCAYYYISNSYRTALFICMCIAQLANFLTSLEPSFLSLVIQNVTIYIFSVTHLMMLATYINSL